MHQVKLSDIKRMAERASGQIHHIYLHWTAGHYGQFFDDYHFSIDKDGAIFASTDDLTERKAHTYQRNTGAVGVSLACCYNATPKDLGPEPPTDAQIEAIAQLIAVLSTGLGLAITDDIIMTHQEAADIDGYGPGSGDPQTRWDLWILKNGDEPGTGGDVLRGKAIWYQQNGVGV